MAHIIYEEREFKDRDTGIVTKYPYIAIKGSGSDSSKYEVQLKNLVQSEKMALLMIHDKENGGSEVVSRKSTTDEGIGVERKSTILDDDDEDEKGGGLFN